MPRTLCFTVLLTLIGSGSAFAQEKDVSAKNSWRSLPLVEDGKVADGWTFTGYGRFDVVDGALRAAPDARGLGLLYYDKEKFGDCRIRVVFRTERGHGPAFLITSIVAQVVLGILASMIVCAFSRWREFNADAGGARLAGREKMIAALERLKAAVDPQPLPEQMTAFGISAPGAMLALLRTHPPLEERIARLRGA